MRRTIIAALTPALLAGFMLVDVVSLDPPARPVDPSIERTTVAGAAWRPLSAAEASLRPSAPLLAPAGGDGTELVTDPIETERFTVAGLTWDPADGDPADIRVRVREDDGWTPWQPLQPNDEGPDAGTEEYEMASAVTGTDPLVTAGADAIQVSLQSPDAEVAPELEVVVIDPGTSPADETVVGSTPLASASAAVGMPAVVTRAQWGANESLRKCSPSYSSTIKAAAVHHTAGTNSYTAAQAPGIVRGIYAYHTQTLGWCDVGYNFMVDKFGTVYEGRFGGVAKAVRGAHAGGFNDKTFGVSALGNYELVPAPSAMVSSISRVIGWKLASFGDNPRGSTTLVSAGGGTARYSAGTTVNVPVVLGHRDVGQTACPGKNLYSQLGTIRAQAAAYTEQGAYVRALYLDMLGRDPGGSEVDFWVPIAEKDRWRAANGFTNSEEYRRRYITAAYADVLGRTPDSTGMAFWLQRLAAGQVRLDDIRPTFMDSTEFYKRAGNTDAGFVGSLYQRALGRDASSTEVGYWSGQLRSKGRSSVISSIYGSSESARIRVDRAYRLWLGRTAATTERAYWEQTVLTRGDEYMRMSAMVSQEYFLRAQRR